MAQQEKLLRIKSKEKTVLELQDNTIRIKDGMVAGIDVARIMGYDRNSVIYDHVREKDRVNMSFTDSATNIIFINRKGVLDLMDGATKCENYHREYINKYILPELPGKNKPTIKEDIKEKHKNEPIKDLKLKLASLEKEYTKKKLELEALRKRIKDKDTEVNKVKGKIYKLKEVIYFIEEEI